MALHVAIEQALHQHFGGATQRGLRQRLRRLIRAGGDVRQVRHPIAMTATGRQRLALLAHAVETARQERP